MSANRGGISGSEFVLSKLLLLTLLPTALAVFVFYAGLQLNVGIVFDEWTGGWNHLCHWDCGWYRSIAENGYQSKPNDNTKYANYGFYPGFPYLAAAWMKVFEAPFLPVALLLNSLLLFAFGVVAYIYRDTLWLKSDSAFLVFFLAFALAPWSLYNRIPYSEMSFNLALLICFVAWQRRCFVIAALAGFLLCTIRVTGIVLPAMLMAELLWRHRHDCLKFLFSFDRRLFALAFMVTGFVSVCLHHYFITGNPLAYFQVQQEAWAQQLRNPLIYFSYALNGHVREIYGLVVFYPVVILLIIAVKRAYIPLLLVTFSALVFLIPLMSKIEAIPRYALALFPIYLLAAYLPKSFQYALLVVFAVGQTFMTYLWIQRLYFLT